MKLSKTLLLPIDLVDKDVVMTSEMKKELKWVKNIKKGFTLAEVLITLTILGVVAAITVPSILQNQQQSANKTKVKKAIAVYENALEQMRVVNSLANVDALKNYVNKDGSCTTGKSYFKVVKDGTNACTFQTGDKVWWNISDIGKTIIAVDDKCVDSAPTSDKNNACYNKSFYLTVEDSADGKFFVYDDPNGDAHPTLTYVGISQKNALERFFDDPGSVTACTPENKKACISFEISGDYGEAKGRTIVYDENGLPVFVSNPGGGNAGLPVSWDKENNKITIGGDTHDIPLNDSFLINNGQPGCDMIQVSCGKTADTCTLNNVSANCCYAKGTKITLADGSTKNVEDICFEDDLMVWDFDNGCMSSSKAIYIQKPEIAHEYNKLVFSNGAVLKTINQHRIFNKELGKYTYPMTDDTPIGTTTLLDDGTEVTLVSKEVVHEPVEYYNIITNYHFNCFASGISTSCRLNNMYPIKDYKFQKDNREIVAFENFHGITREWYEGLRLGEQPQDINRENAVVFDKSLNDYVTRLIRKNDESKRLALV